MPYQTIAGGLPFAGGGKTYASAYNAALQMNSKNYSNILQGYQQTMSSQQQQQAQIGAGYNTLTNQVLGGIQGMDAAQRQAIADQYMTQKGQSQQQLINRGLGNSTVQQAIDRGLTYDAAKANIALTGQTQGINAQYLSQLGSQALGYQAHALDQSTGLAKSQLDWMNSVNAAYPNASAYAQLAQMKGMGALGAGGYGGGAITQGGAVKSPLSGQVPSAIPSYGNIYGGNQFGFGGPRPNRGGGTQTLSNEYYPFDPADPFYQTAQGQAVGGGTLGVDSGDYSAGFPGWSPSTPGYENTVQVQGDGAPAPEDMTDYYHGISG